MLKIIKYLSFGIFKSNKIINFLICYIFILFHILLSSEMAFSEANNIKNSINGSGLNIPRIVSTKNSLTYIRTGPGKEFPIKFELIQKGYPLKIVAEFNNWRKINTQNELTGWVHTQLLSSFKTGLIINDTYLKRSSSISSRTKAKLLKGLLINVLECKVDWCKIEVNKDKSFWGWVNKENIWGAVFK